jgi:hypothetical protein
MILGISEASPKKLFEESEKAEANAAGEYEDPMNKPKSLQQMKKRDYLKDRRYNQMI